MYVSYEYFVLWPKKSLWNVKNGQKNIVELQKFRNLGCLQMQNFQRKKLQNVEFSDKKVVDLQISRAGVDVEFDNL